jgi:hypothetical protein
MNQKVDQAGLLKQLFNEDQVTMLKRRSEEKSYKFLKWSNKTIVNALRLKFSCSGSGYEELLRQKLPLPSVRTLQRKLQNLNFDSDILDEVLKFLHTKIQTFAPSERDCALVLHEMAITSASVYDISLNKFLDKVTLPDHTGVATHVLVFMLAGIKARWKQVMGYYFSGNSIKGVIIINGIIEKILQKAEPLGLNVLSVTSDMGASSQALWKVWGITAGRHSDIKSKTSHPTVNPKICDDSIEYFMDIFRRMEVGHKRTWKPSQTGVLMSTESLLGLQAELLENRGYDFILTSRFSKIVWKIFFVH